MGDTDLHGKREQAIRDLAFLAQITPSLLGAALDYEAVVERAAELLVPALGDWCAVDVVGANGSVHRVAVAHADPELREASDALRAFGPEANGSLLEVLETGQGALFEHLTDDVLRAAARSDEHLALLKKLTPGSAIILPLPSRGRILGTLTLVRSDESRRYTTADLHLAEDVARRVAVAIDNASLYEKVADAERRFRGLVESIDGIVWEADVATLAFTFVSKRLEEIFGYSTQKWLEDSRFAETTLHPDDRTAVVAARRRAASEGVEQRLEYRAFTADGRVLWVQERIHVVCNADGHPLRLHGLITDVTDRKIAEARQDAQHAIVRAIAEARSVGESAGKILESVCTSLEWDVGLLWTLDERIGRLRCLDVWTSPGVEARRFEQMSRSLTMEAGVGLPGRVWASRAPAWVRNVVIDDNFPRAPVALEENLHGAFGFPLTSGSTFVGVIEFFSREVRDPDEELLRMMGTVGEQVGQFIVRQRVEEESNFRKLLLEAQFDATIDGLFVLSPDLSVLYYNKRLLEMWGVTDEEASDRATFIAREKELVVDPNQFLRLIEQTYRQPLMPSHDEIALRDGRTFDRYSAPLLGPDDTFYGRIIFFRDVTEQKRIERILRESKERNEFLAEASGLLATSLDVRTTLRSFARLLVPTLGDWCAVDVVDDDGQLQRLAWSHADPAKAEIMRTLVERYPPGTGAQLGSPNVVQSGRSELRETVTEEMLARDDDETRMVRALGLRSAMIVPLIARGRTLGALTIVSSRRNYEPGDVSFAEEIAARAALAVDNARLYSERSHVARTLQQSLLPPVLPAVPGVALAARYHPAGQGNDVGGDFYDVFATGRDDWAVVMGDVCGKGSEAAAITALARYTVRAAAMQAKKPSRVLATLNEAMLRQRSDRRYCTVAYVRVRRVEEGIRATIACGGHPQPFVIRADGRVELAGIPGTLLGFFPDPELTDHTMHLAPGETLVLYTDGVTEARRGKDVFGEERLRAFLERCRGWDATSIAERLEAQVLEFQSGVPRDDIAILVVKATE
jgi:PAS domain S-box-containing protein